VIKQSIKKVITFPIAWPVESSIDLGTIAEFGTPYVAFDTLTPDADGFYADNVSGTAASGWNISGISGDKVRVRGHFEALSGSATPQFSLKAGALQSGTTTNRSNTEVFVSASGWFDFTLTATGAFASLVMIEANSFSTFRISSLHISRS
jgi:hypothetical protein